MSAAIAQARFHFILPTSIIRKIIRDRPLRWEKFDRPIFGANQGLMLRNLRASENFHIVLWLVKDLCWVMIWKPLGLAMFVPTFLLAIVIAWRSRAEIGELLHSLAVVCWIAANGIWMVGEFWFNDTKRHWSVPFFVAGLLLVGWYYIVVLPRRQRSASAPGATQA